MDDRRRVPDPKPPPGEAERRHCSDEECMGARTLWYEETLLPKLKFMFWQGIGAAIFACCAAIFFIVNALITNHTLEATKTMGTEYVKVVRHNEDIARLEKSFDKLGNDMTAAISRVLQNQEIIIDAQRARK